MRADGPRAAAPCAAEPPGTGQAGSGGQLSGDSTPSTYALATSAVRPCTRQRRASRVRW